MNNFYDCADYIIENYNSEQKLTSKRLQKLIFIARTLYSIKNKGKRMIEGEFRAWKHGPIDMESYDIYNSMQKGKTSAPEYQSEEYRHPLYSFNRSNKLSEDIIDILDEVLFITKNISTISLIENSYLDTPWEKDCLERTGNIISVEESYRYFSKYESFKKLLLDRDTKIER